MDATHGEEVKSCSEEVCEPSMDEWDPWDPPCPPCPPVPPGIGMFALAKLINQWYDEVDEVLATSRRTKIIIPDRTPEDVVRDFYGILPKLMPILKKDSVRRFLDLFELADGGLVWTYIITPLTLTQMVKQNALRCAKVALAGKAPKLHGFRANPNCMNIHGYFPLHEAAEMFSVDMIKLLFRYNASANVRTAGAEVIEGLLPLHVAVENSCLHKYLEDYAFLYEEDLDNQSNVNYVCKLIHLLCLPEMKLFLDTTRLLAEHTDNLIDELWNYIEGGNIIQSAVLLLAAQKQIRGCLSRNRNGKSKLDGFQVTINRILNHIVSLESGNMGKEKLGVNKSREATALLLVHAVSQAGEALDEYIRSNPVVPFDVPLPRKEMSHHVSLILKNNGFCPTGVELGNLSCYGQILSEEVPPNKHGDTVAKAPPGMPCLNSKAEKDVRKRMHRGWDLEFLPKSYFPYWRSVLNSKIPLNVVPLEYVPRLAELKNSRNKSASQGSLPIQDFNLGLAERFKKFSNQHKRTFCSVAVPLLKVLRKA